MGGLRMRGPATRAGLKYGLISGVISLGFTAFDIAIATSQALRSHGPLQGLIALILLPVLIYYILLPMFAGRLAARQTGSVGGGAIAGLVACIVSTLVALPGTVLYYIVTHHTVTIPIPIAFFGRLPAVVQLVIWEVIWAGIALAMYALLGALGGLVGRRAYRRTLSGYETPSQRRVTTYETPSRRRVTTERTVLLGLALFLLVVGMCVLSTMSER
jgi:hypothetical protein